MIEQIGEQLVEVFPVSKSEILSRIIPGDCLLYNWKRSLFSFIIGIKTWHTISHCEVYAGSSESFASRDGEGVNWYPFRFDNLSYILRPPANFNYGKSRIWFNTVRGQGYDYLGLLRFAWASGYDPLGKNNKMFCSEFLARFYNKGDWYLFNNEPPDSIAPFQFLLAPFVKIMKVD